MENKEVLSEIIRVQDHLVHHCQISKQKRPKNGTLWCSSLNINPRGTLAMSK